MSWKSIVIAGLLCVLAVPAWAAPSVRVTSLNDLTTPAGANRQWLVEILPDAADLPSALAAELAFSHAAGSSTQPTGIVDGDADNTNGAAGDTWYYNETAAGSGTILWNTTDAPVDASNENQNTGNNPFTASITEGLYTSGSDLFAALGSTIFPDPTASVNTLHIVTSGRGGILNMGDSIVAQNGAQGDVISAASFYVPGDFSGDGIVGSPDFDLILQYFGQAVDTSAGHWDGRAPFNGATATSADFDRLLANFGAGTASGGSGSLAGGGAVPEPASLVLVFLGAMLTAVCGRRSR
jgi:PEP-CTERM motif